MSRRRGKQEWYVQFITGLFLLQLVVMTAWKDHSFVAIHDNLDLFVAHNTMMKKAGLFFSAKGEAPMLGGISRDLLGGEFTLYNLLYLVFQPYTAYVVGYCLKILIGFGGSLLWAKEVLGDKYEGLRELVWLTAAAFSLIPVFPAYGIAFTSLPLAMVLLRRIDIRIKPVTCVLLFFYPCLSYFSYFGFFLLAYLAAAIVFLWIKRRRFPLGLSAAVLVLSGGYVVWEYRLFRKMLLDPEVTIRSTMINAETSLWEVMDKILEGVITPVFHAQDSHVYWVIWICLGVVLAINLKRVREGKKRRFFEEMENGIALLILFNCVIYGLYDYKPFRDLFEMFLPMLTGFQFNRTIFFNPFLWYLLFFLCLVRIRDGLGSKETGKKAARFAGIMGVLVCMFIPQVYNDFYSNIYHHAYELVMGVKSSQLSFREFYSEKLFERIKDELNYQGQWAVAFGMHPAILQYNGISTLDGYLGMYSQEYKEKFREVIEPALEQAEEFAVLYDTWGARAYLYSASGENTYRAERNPGFLTRRIDIDTQALRRLGGTYIFSRVEAENAKESGLVLEGIFEGEASPYTIYVYRLI